MKLYMSVDMEGITGVVNWDDTMLGHAEHTYYRKIMTYEVLTICKEAKNNGIREILIKDAHASGRNLFIDELPEYVSVIRGWSGHPFSMVQGLDGSFDAVFMIGYHSPSGSLGNPLSHTMASSIIREMRLNGHRISEFTLHALVAGYFKVPVTLLTGDEEICREAKEHIPSIITLQTKVGFGNAVITKSLAKVSDEYKSAIKEALNTKIFRESIPLVPISMSLEISYSHPTIAYKYSFFPGAVMINESTLKFETENVLDLMTFIQFCS
ncbi:MAG: M55 family metallopeptidase [Candidatus Marinimicrobia bacterium]|nr:M55 family metallopeptidase [Candidatus Neomarinimicrobiota bacterium]MDD5581977.1 M55 family metallopeptidase [Candidatus Neomarinimicrobiota bacterium]